MDEFYNKKNEKRFSLFMDYHAEMLKMCPQMPTHDEESMRKICKNYLVNPNYTWIDLVKDKVLVGFVIIASGSECHPDCDFFLQDAYLIPDKRGKGDMTRALSMYINKNPGIYYLHVLEVNQNAKKFWEHLFADCLNATQIDKPLLRQEPDFAIKQYVYNVDTMDS